MVTQTQVEHRATRTKWVLLLSPEVAKALGEVEEDGYTESSSAVHRAADPMPAESGIRYQRCGGGRRIIRKQGGRSY